MYLKAARTGVGVSGDNDNFRPSTPVSPLALVLEFDSDKSIISTDENDMIFLELRNIFINCFGGALNYLAGMHDVMSLKSGARMYLVYLK